MPDNDIIMTTGESVTLETLCYFSRHPSPLMASSGQRPAYVYVYASKPPMKSFRYWFSALRFFTSTRTTSRMESMPTRPLSSTTGR